MQGCQEQKLFETEMKQNLVCDDCFCEKSQENLYSKVHVKLDTRDSAKLTFSFPADLEVQDALHLRMNFNSQKGFLWLKPIEVKLLDFTSKSR